MSATNLQFFTIKNIEAYNINQQHYYLKMTFCNPFRERQPDPRA